VADQAVVVVHIIQDLVIREEQLLQPDKVTTVVLVLRVVMDMVAVVVVVEELDLVMYSMLAEVPAHLVLL